MINRALSLVASMLWLGMFFVMSVSQSVAQGTASISGTAVDASQAIVTDSQVVLTNIDTAQARMTTSSGQGYFAFTDLTPGNYKLRVNKTGFKAWEQSSITLTVGQNLTVYPLLQVGSTTEQVEVTAAAPLINTSTSTISQVVNSVQIEQLPLNGRNALQLVALAPGVVSTGTAGQFGATQLTFASSGGRDIDTNYNLDGGINEDAFYAIANEYPNPDALQEFAITSRNYSAKFGRGSTDVSAVTRSGTNSLHGSIYEFLRNTKLDATPYFSTTRPNFHRNQFGASVGGPIIRNKLFFFLSYQGTQQSGGPGNQTYTTVPLAERTGNFSAVSTPVIDPKTGKQFPGNIIPANRITPQATTFFQNYLPAPNQGLSTYSFANVGTLQQHQGIAKVDYQLTQHDLLFARYFINDVPQVAYGSGSGSALDTTWLSNLPTIFQNTTIGEVHTFSSHLLNDFHLTYVRSAFGLFPEIQFSLTKLGYGVNTGNAFSQYGLSPDSAITIGGSFSAYPGAPTRDIMPTTHLSDNVSLVKGIHTINAGIEIYKNRINETQNFFTGGALDFNGQFTGVGAADFLLGQFDNYTQIGGLSSRLHQTLPSAYVQDDIKVSPRITVSAGVRWDIASGYSSEDNQLISLQPGKQSTVFPLATPGLLFPGDAGIPKNVVGTRWNNFAPRLGIAWDVRGNGRTSVRAGFGTFYVPLTRGITFNRLTLIQPYTLEVGISGGDAESIFAGAPYNGVNPFPRATGNDLAELKKLPFVPTAGESSLPTTFKTEGDYQWSLSLQQALWTNAVLETDYVGSAASHLTTSAESNPAVYIPGASTPSNTQSRRIYPQIGSVNSILNVLSANYEALQIVFNQQFTRGIFVKSAYTWSKALGVGGAETEGSNGPRDPFDYRLDYGPSDFDVNQNWVTSVIWQPLEGRGFSPVVKTLIGGWQLGGISTLHSGTPLNLTSGLDNSLTGIGSDTPDVVGNYHIANHSKADQIAHWFNPAAFTQNAIGTFGTLGHNALRNPGYVNVDLNIQKNFMFAEKYGVEFRSSLYNAFNHANLVPPQGTLTSGNFGQILSTTDPRVIEFGLRLKF
jgi:Carboxypeptidase regulatory-like domain